MSDPRPTAEQLFLAAIERSADERSAFIRQQSAGDVQLAKETEQLLEFHQSDHGACLLDQPMSATRWFGDQANAPIGEQVGSNIGPYRLLEKIGEGGMGAVYMAEQKENLNRKVALKIIKLGMDTRNVVARFEAERQAMALFDHPNIAKVLDAGSTESGRPYFVMELVRGTNLMDYAAMSKLDLQQRLELFIQICHAVQHAHHKGIIHRDLKPSNVLVTNIDGNPVPKVIDFGVAKAIGQRLTEKTLFTRYAAMIGTPQYMSPEQAELSGADVDTRSDIYSLGVLLYELVTGTTPLSRDELKVNPLALHETLRDANFETPSSRASRRLASDSVPHPVHDARGRIKNELDWVVMKSLAADRTQRYESASELAADIRRFLDGDSVLAVPPSRLYRLQRLFFRHQTAIVSAAVVSVILIALTIASIAFALRANQFNQDLTTALAEARSLLTRAETAEEELRVRNREQAYDVAHNLALAKITCSLMYRFEKILNDEKFDKTIAALSKSELAQDVIGEPFCFDFDLIDLLHFPQFADVELPVQQIRKSIEDANQKDESICEYCDAQLSRFFDEEIENQMAPPLPLSTTVEIDSQLFSPLAQRMSSHVPEIRVEFFRLLVAEYRMYFGEHSPQVADGLALLACALIEMDEVNEAKSRLREAIAVAPENQLYRELLSRFGKKPALD